MKRALLLSALVVLAAFPLSGQTLTAGPVSALCGQTVSVPVVIADASGVISLEFRLVWDAKKLTARSAARAELTSGFQFAANVTAGSAKIAMASGNPVSGSGPVAFVTFQVPPMKSGEITLKLEDVLVNDTAAATTPGLVTVSCGGTTPKPDPAP